MPKAGSKESVGPLVRLTLEGLPAEGGHVLVSDFIRSWQLLVSALNRTERSALGGRDGSVYYRVVGLSHSSPAVVEMEAVSRPKGSDRPVQVLREFARVVSSVQSGAVEGFLDGALLEDIRALCAPVDRTLARVSVSLDGDEVVFGKDIQRRVEQMLAREESFDGRVRGMLESINIHGTSRVFRIYPEVGPEKVLCEFPEPLKAAAISGVGRYVEVRGRLRYRVNASFPHEVEVHELELLPEASELPTLWDLRGAAPNATADLTSEEFVRRLRDAGQ